MSLSIINPFAFAQGDPGPSADYEDDFEGYPITGATPSGWTTHNMDKTSLWNVQLDSPLAGLKSLDADMGTGSAGSSALTLNGSSLADGTIECLIRGPASSSSVNPFGGLIARLQDADTWVCAFIRGFGGTGNITVQQRSSGTFTVLATESVALATGTTYKLEFDLDGVDLTARLYDTSNNLLATVSSSDATVTAAGLLGFRAGGQSGTSTITFDNLKATIAP